MADGGLHSASDTRQRFGLLRAGQVVTQLLERDPDDVPVAEVEPHGVDRLEPECVDQVEIVGRQRRRVRAELEVLGLAIQLVGQQPRAELRAARHAFPRLAEEARLVGRRDFAESPRTISLDARRTAVRATASNTLLAGTTSSFTVRPLRSATATTLVNSVCS